MVDAKTGTILGWIATGLLLLLLLLSFRGTGAWMGGMGFGWMMVWPVLLLGLVLYLAYRFGRSEEQTRRQP